jgi:putative transposase
LITSACYKHCPVFEIPDDLSWLTDQVLDAFAAADLSYLAWSFLPNHYHILVETRDLSIESEVLRLLHSRTSTAINGRHRQRGRKVWYRFSDRLIRSERHYFATVNYIHYNPIKHGYTDRMSSWPWSSVREYVQTQGKEWLKQTWSAYPVRNYGQGWDW